MNFIDLFAGAGGLSEGFMRAGFKSVAHVEKDRSACYTLKTRLAYYYLLRKNKIDIYIDYLKGVISRVELYKHIPEKILNSVINAEISGKTNPEIFIQIDEYKGKRDIDLIIGGPPCQAYSDVGRPALKHKKNDERKMLYLDYAKYLIRYKPKVFIFENVPGLYTSDHGRYYKNLRMYFKRIGYNLDDKILDASLFGVLQKRRRVFIVGWRKDIDMCYPKLKEISNKWTVSDIFNDLPCLSPGEELRTAPYRTESNEYLTHFNIRNGLDFVTQNYTRYHNHKDLTIYSLAIDHLFEKNRRIKNYDIPSECRTQKNVSSFLDRFKVVNLNDLSHTLIAHISNDGHYYIHPDKRQLRSISVREAARIQSFPDDYYFESTEETQVRTSAFRQIGNAVPPLLAYALAKGIIKQF